MPELPRCRLARALAESALVRLVTAYGEPPEFALLGGLVPDLLCLGVWSASTLGPPMSMCRSTSKFQSGADNAGRLEDALQDSGFMPSGQCVWRWQDNSVPGSVAQNRTSGRLTG